MKQREKKTLEGFELIQKEIINILEKFNVKKIDALRTNLLMQTFIKLCLKSLLKILVLAVCEIVQDGYKFHDRLLRPAMVGIAKADEKKKEEDKIEEESKKDDKQSKV